MTKIVVGITGASGSGKSFIAKYIIDKSPIEGIILGFDNYYYDIDMQPLDKNNKPNFDTPHSLDLVKFKNDFFKLKSGLPISCQVYEYNNNRNSTNTRTIELFPKELLIIEGIFALYDEEIFCNCDITLFIDSDLNTSLKRRLYRDQLERGYSSEDIIYNFEHHVIESYNKYVLPLKSKVDIIIENNEDNDVNLDEILLRISELSKKRKNTQL